MSLSSLCVETLGCNPKGIPTYRGFFLYIIALDCSLVRKCIRVRALCFLQLMAFWVGVDFNWGIKDSSDTLAYFHKKLVELKPVGLK
jgi:hypothetical protein